MNKWLKNPIIVILAFVLGFCLVYVVVGHTAELSPDMRGSVLVTLENCQPQTWVGMVRWLDNKTDYEDVPGFELKYAGSISMMLPQGEYGITHYRPRIIVEIDGQTLIYPAAILEFRDVVVGDAAITFPFGCEE